MKTKNILLMSLMAAATLTSCSGKLGQLSGDYFKVNPNPLVADGGQVDATINDGVKFISFDYKANDSYTYEFAPSPDDKVKIDISLRPEYWHW